MKKHILFAAILLAVLLSSCAKRKEFICECIDNATGNVTGSVTVEGKSTDDPETICQNASPSGEKCTPSP